MKKVTLLLIVVVMVFASCKKSEEETITDPQIIGLVGEWYSSGTNVAPLLVTYFQIDSIYAKFQDNNTYKVESFSGGSKTTYTGTFTQAKANVGTIWNITLNQTTPSVVTSVGIFDISTAVTPYLMKYEVVQTEPPAGTAPTAAAGFGSTNGGAIGTINVQKFLKIVK